MSTKKEEQKQDSGSSGTTNPQEAKSRKDATTIAKKLETLVDEKEGKKYSVDQQSHGMIKALDGSKENIRQGINEAKAEIPRFTQIVKDFQETAIESTKEISDAFIESQRQVISSLQSVWIPNLVYTYGSIWNYWTLQPIISDIYVSMVRITADNMIAATRLANNIIFTNIEAAKVLMPQLKDNADHECTNEKTNRAMNGNTRIRIFFP
ncbi:MAG: hypothetical protein FIO02_07700 [Nitrosopumilales archaeon]|nr:hypothetical protein [Nitrosopumilales archaeon]